jgi:hypothetical protein
MFKVYIRTKFHIPNFNDLLVTIIKPRATDNFRTAVIFLPYIWKNYTNGNCIFYTDLWPHTSHIVIDCRKLKYDIGVTFVA